MNNKEICGVVAGGDKSPSLIILKYEKNDSECRLCSRECFTKFPKGVLFGSCETKTDCASQKFQVLKMTGSDNADAKWRENNVEGEGSWRTAHCLRGRLLAERMASRNAREEAEQLRIRLLEVEGLLKQEAKSRNRAERKLKHLMKRLEFMNISYAVDESEKQIESPKGSLNVEDSKLSLWSSSQDSSNSSFEPKNDECEVESNQNSKPSEAELNSDEQSFGKCRMESSVDEEGLTSSGEDDRYLMAIVPVEDGKIEAQVLDATVEQVLESLQRAKEQLQSSMERRRMGMKIIKVG